MKRLFFVALLLGSPAMAVPVVPNFTQGSMTSHTETTQKITETINSMDYSTGYQYSVTGSGVTANGNLSPGTGSNNVTINGVTSSWTGVTSKPSFTQTTPGAAFQFTETLSAPGLQNHTIIQRTTDITSITDTTSIFSQEDLTVLSQFKRMLKSGVLVLQLLPLLILQAVLQIRQSKFYKDPTLQTPMGMGSSVRDPL